MRASARSLAAAVVAVALLGAGCGGDDSSDDAATTTTTRTVTSTTPTTTAATCSASAVHGDLPDDPGLPPAVAAMRADLARAAVECDYDALAVLVDRNGKSVRYSFGEGNDPIAAWRLAESSDDQPPPLLALRLLLALPHGERHAEGVPATYLWPAAFATDHPTDAQLQEIADTGLYDLSTLKQWVASGTNYLGYRVMISESGDWQAFVAGD
jgi:hypothetical protein